MIICHASKVMFGSTCDIFDNTIVMSGFEPNVTYDGIEFSRPEAAEAFA